MKLPWQRMLALLICILFVGIGAAQTKKARESNPADDPKPAETVKPTQRPFLWIIESKQAKKPSFVLGTIHLPDARATTLPDVTKEALRVSDALYTEIPLDMQTVMAMIPRIMRSDGKTLKDAIGEKLYAQLTKFVESKGASMGMFDNMKTAFVSTQLAMLDNLKELQASMPLDMQLYTQAQQDDKAGGGLETVDEQVGIFDAISDAEGAKILEKTMQDIQTWDREHPKQPIYDYMVELYYAGDGQKLYEMAMTYFNPDEMVSKKLYDKLITERDKHMAERMGKKITENPEKSHFFAVGALHLLSKDTGVIDRLQKAGFSVRRLTPADTEAVAKLSQPDNAAKAGKEVPREAEPKSKSKK